MPVPTPFHPRTSQLCTSLRYKEWAGCYAVCSYDTHHDAEYYAVRHSAGLLDVTPLYKYLVSGPDAGTLLAYVTTRDVTRLRVGQSSYCTWCDPEGKVLDDGTVTRLGDDEYRVTTADPAWRWFVRFADGLDVRVEDVSRTVAALSLQGPTSRAVLAQACDDSAGVETLRFFRALSTRVAGCPVDVTRTGYTGDLGYEIWCKNDDALKVWDTLVEAGAPYDLLPMGLDALDVCRVEAGFLLMGVDYFSARSCLLDSQKSTPDELGLGWTVHVDRGNFLGRDAIRRERQQGSAWALVGLDIDWEELEELYESFQLPPSLPTCAWRTAVPVYDGVVQVGQATSGAWSPTLKKNLALASVRPAYAAPGTKLKIEWTVEYQRRTVGATVVERPFFDPERKRSTPALQEAAS